MAQPTSPEGEEWPCPGFTTHPQNTAGPPEVVLSWQDETRSTCTAERRRVIFHTCACLETSYEFLGVGGMYGFRRIRRSAPNAVAYAGPWQRGRAEKLWLLLINGQAR